MTRRHYIHESPRSPFHLIRFFQKAVHSPGLRHLVQRFERLGRLVDAGVQTDYTTARQTSVSEVTMCPGDVGDESNLLPGMTIQMKFMKK